ncbi:hypothetical protein K8R42_04325, partial [bacterium]|nr:hypothetical protein [bacterium]
DMETNRTIAPPKKHDKGRDLFLETESEEEISEKYLIFNTQKLVEELLYNFNKWLESGTADSVLYISNIQDSLNKYRKYLYMRSENRLFISLLDLIFENNSWLDMSDKDIKLVLTFLERVRNGKISHSDINSFSNRVYSSDIVILK